MLDTSAPTHELLDRVEVTSATDLLVKYDNTSAALAGLTVKYGSAVFDCTVPEQDKQARAARRELVGLRTTLEAKRVELKAPYLEIGKEIDQKAAFLKTAIAALELPIDAQIKIEEDRKEELKREAQRVEFERCDAIKAKIAVITRVRIDALRMSAPQIEAALSAEFDFGDFAEFEVEARAAYEETCQALQNMLALRMQQEDEQAQLQKDRAALDAQAAENQRVAAELKAKQDAELASERAAMAAQAAENQRIAEAAKAALDAERAVERAAMAAERAEQDKQQAIANAALNLERAELVRQAAAIKAKADADIAVAQASERAKNMASEIAKARLCSAAPMMLNALKMVFALGVLSSEQQAQVQEAIVAAEGGAL